jgi:hypothetical protein
MRASPRIVRGLCLALVLQLGWGASQLPLVSAKTTGKTSAKTTGKTSAKTTGKTSAETTGRAVSSSSSSLSITLSLEQEKQLSLLENQAIKYFLDNQTESGLIFDRQTNFGQTNKSPWISLSATGMGLIAIALASGPNHHLITRAEAIARVRKALLAAKSVPAIHGMMPHFFDPVTLKWQSNDQVSTIDSSWLIAGGLWAAKYLKDDSLEQLADELYNRVDWDYWANTDTASGAPVLCMGMDEKGNHWKSLWDRINSEAAFMYIMAIGARNHALPPSAWAALKPYNKKVAGVDLAGGDLGLFAFQYSNELMDLNAYKGNKVDLYSEAIKGARANYAFCRELAGQYKTYGHFWGLSAGDGPPAKGQSGDPYRAYAPNTDVDGTAHVMATLASIDVAPDLVLANVKEADALTSPQMHGRYGFSNINLDKNWVSSDVVGIDVGAAVMALENTLNNNEVRKVWQELPCSKRAAARLASL